LSSGIASDFARSSAIAKWKIQWVFSDDAMGTTEIKEWYNRVKDGRTSVESDACSGRPSTSQNDELIDQVQTLVMQDHRVTV
jgi:hypothetical protein